jgi:Transposase DNA-binding
MVGVNYGNTFGDKRLGKRGLELNNGLFINSVHSIQQIAQNRAQQIGFYRFLDNDKVTEDLLIKELSNRCNKLCKDKIVLAILDELQ